MTLALGFFMEHLKTRTLPTSVRLCYNKNKYLHILCAVDESGEKMKRVFKYIGRMKLRNKILVCFLLLISLAFAITTYSSYNVVSNLMENEVHELAAISVSQISKNIDLYLDELYRLTNMSLADESFRRAIRASTGSSQQMSDSTNEIFQFLFKIIYTILKMILPYRLLCQCGISLHFFKAIPLLF